MSIGMGIAIAAPWAAVAVVAATCGEEAAVAVGLFAFAATVFICGIATKDR